MAIGAIPQILAKLGENGFDEEFRLWANAFSGQITNINGSVGALVKGNGVETVLLIQTVGVVKTYRMTFTDSSYVDFDVTDGANGTNGIDGADGANGEVTANGAFTLTNKTLSDISNTIHADVIHYEVQATEAIAKGDLLVADGVTDDTVIKVAKRSSLSQPIVGIAEDLIANGNQGTAVNIGVVSGISNAESWNVGDVLYGNSSGGFTTNANISTSSYSQPLAYVVKRNPSFVTLIVNVHSGHDYAQYTAIDASGFSGNLSGTDTNVQVAMQTIDAMSSGGVTDHTALSNIGTNTHAQIDTHLTDATKHRVINDAGTSVTELFSASEIISRLAGKEPSDANIIKNNVVNTVVKSFNSERKIKYLNTGGLHTIDLSESNNFHLFVSENITLDLSSFRPGQSGIIAIIQDNGGSKTIGFNSRMKFADGTAPTLSTADGSIDLIPYYVYFTDVMCNFIADFK